LLLWNDSEKKIVRSGIAGLAAKTISEAYAQKSKLKEAAEKAAAEVNEKFEDEQKQKFQAEVESKDDSSMDFDQKLKGSSQKEIEKIEVDFLKSEELVTKILLHHVTTVKLEVPDALKQLALTQAKEGKKK